MLEAMAVSKTFKTTQALKEISLKIAKGDVYGIIGMSGAGKSTLIRCLSRLILPSSGKILFHGIDIGSLSGKALRDFHMKTGMIFQHFNLLSSRTVRGNVAYPLEIAKNLKQTQESRVEELLHFVGLLSKIDCHPNSLSGGEKQRVGIARALANNPEVLFCDEATSALDPRTTQEILDLLKTLNKKLRITIVLITHDMEVIKKICNKTAVIEAGRIVEEGSVSAVFGDPQHPTTQRFIERSIHEIPPDWIQPTSPKRKLLRLRYKGKAAAQPVISHIVKKFDVEANILLGWIDHLQTVSVGTLVIELTGSAEGIGSALRYLTEQGVHWEALEHAI
jgi:D-methionine transport system ATP-binding protein